MRYSTKLFAADGFTYRCDIEIDPESESGTFRIFDKDNRPAASLRGLPVSELHRLGREIRTACEAHQAEQRRLNPPQCAGEVEE